MHATEGSAALDLTTDTFCFTFSPKVECYKLTTGVYGPFPSGTVEIILGKSGLTSQGFIVHPGVVDGNSKEKIKIMGYVKKEMQIDPGDRIAQLLFLYIKGKAAPVERTGAFGSTGKCVFWKSLVNDQRPKLIIQMNGVDIEGWIQELMSVYFPQSLGIQIGHTQFIGIVKLSGIRQSVQWVICVGPERQTGKQIPFVADIPIDLW
jgi:dUTPase